MPSANSKDRPVTIAFNGTEFLAVWRTASDVLHGARISNAGVNLDGPQGFAISNGSDFYPWVCYGANQFLVAWHGWGTNGLDVFVARIATDGTVRDPGGFYVAQSDGDQSQASVSFEGNNFLVVWHDSHNSDEYSNGGVYGTRIPQDGVVLDPAEVQISDIAPWQEPVQSAFDGNDFLVAWHAAIPAKFRLSDVYAL